MKRTIRLFGKIQKPIWASLFLSLALVLAACTAAPSSIPGTGATQAPAATTAPQPTLAPTMAPTVAATSAPTTASVEEPTINVATDPTLGKILVDGKGMTLYMFAKDVPDKSNCSAGCIKSWPPLLSQGSPKAGTGVDASMLGTTTLADGSKIVTYNHMPLYFFVKDTKPGDVNGQNVNSVWFVVSPDGKPVGKSDQSAGTSTAGTASPTTAAASASGPAQVKVSNDPKLGAILTDAKGMTLYVFKKDTPDKSNCTAGCLKAWPPFVTNGQPVAGQGVDDSKLGTTTLADGSKIVTYNHMPLYYWAGDVQPGDTNGQNVQNVWFVVNPDGKPVDNSTSSPSSGGGGYSNPGYNGG